MVKQFIMTRIYSAHFTVITGALLLFSNGAWAQNNGPANVGTVMNSVIFNMGFIPALTSSISYITGIGFTIMGLIKMRDYVDNPSQNFMKDALARLLIGAALILLPFAVQVAAGTIGAKAAVTISKPTLYK